MSTSSRAWPFFYCADASGRQYGLMRLEPPLLSLIQNCETICVAACCGRDAFDFSPIHIASYLLRHTGRLSDSDVETLRMQLDTLSANYGAQGASGRGATLDDLNERMSGEAVDRFVSTLQTNLKRATRIIATEATGSFNDV